MPCIKIDTNKSINNIQEENIKNYLGDAIKYLGKSESWLMLEFNPDRIMYFKGNKDNSLAYIDVCLYGRCSSEQYNIMTREITNIINRELNIENSNIYVSYTETNNWGWNGSNF